MCRPSARRPPLEGKTGSSRTTHPDPGGLGWGDVTSQSPEQGRVGSSLGMLVNSTASGRRAALPTWTRCPGLPDLTPGRRRGGWRWGTALRGTSTGRGLECKARDRRRDGFGAETLMARRTPL